MNGIEVGKQEYEKLCNNASVDQSLIQHPSFKEAFIGFFATQIDVRQGVTVTVEGNSVVIRSNNNFPEASNGIYRGYENYNKCILQIERDCLSVKHEGASVFSFPNRQYDSLVYSSRVTAYDGINEIGYVSFIRDCDVPKGYKPIYALDDYRSNPQFTVASVLTETLREPADGSKWKAESCRRRFDGVVYRTFQEKVNDYTMNSSYAYGSIGIEHPERLRGNVSDFAVLENRKWMTADGVPLSAEELDRMIQDYSASFSKSTSHSR